MHFYTTVSQYKSNILVSGYLNGKRYYEKVKYQPYLFLPSDEPTGYKSLDGKDVFKKTFKNIWEAKKFFYEYKDVDNFNVYGSHRFAYTYIRDQFSHCKYDITKIKTCTLDIEVSMEDGKPDIETADKEITAITVMYDNITFALGYGEFVPTDGKTKYIRCTDEIDLLKKFIKIWSSTYRPDVITGWYIDGFDIPYIINRIIGLLGIEAAESLSPFGVLQERQFKTFNRVVKGYSIVGVAVLDYHQLYKKFILEPREQYSLNYICYEELGEKKLDYSDYEDLNGLYKQNHQLFMEYNVRDCELVVKLEKKLKLLELVYTFAYQSGVNYIDALKAVSLWDTIIHNHLLDKHIVVPQKDRDFDDDDVVGAFVKPPQTGLHRWVVSFDLTSLYPSLIMAYNISPETFKGMLPMNLSHDDKVEQWIEGMPPHIAEKLQKDNVSLAANGAMFSREKQGFLSILMQELFEQRKAFKDQMLEFEREYEKTKHETLKYDIAKFKNLQMTAKVKLNSAYGGLANEGFRFYSVQLAEAITLSGQLTIKFAASFVNSFLNKKLGTKDVDYVITSDTDSLYINMEGIVNGFGECSINDKINRLDAFCKNDMQTALNEAFGELAARMNCHKQTLHMKRENICESGIFIAKKRYVLKVWDSEGTRYKEAKIKMTGIEAVRSSTPACVRQAIKDTITIILNEGEKPAQEFIKSFKQKFMEMPFHEIARNSTLNGLAKYSDSVKMYKSKTPQHVKGAIMFNKALKDAGLVGKFTPLYEGDKIKYCYLKTPNPIGIESISATVVLPKELGLDKYLDKHRQFEKTYYDPMKAILDTIGYDIEDSYKITDFF